MCVCVCMCVYVCVYVYVYVCWQTSPSQPMVVSIMVLSIELAPLGYRSAAIFVELSSAQGLESRFIKLKYTRYSRDNFLLIHKRMCRIHASLRMILKHVPALVYFVHQLFMIQVRQVIRLHRQMVRLEMT